MKRKLFYSTGKPNNSIPLLKLEVVHMFSRNFFFLNGMCYLPSFQQMNKKLTQANECEFNSKIIEKSILIIKNISPK